MKSQFEFSVIMAVYNTARFLEQAVESLIHQTYGFDRIQLILVDDGSTDGSGDICDAYAERYPRNVVVIHQENAGQSSARNVGIQHATGTWLNFLDSDDYLDTDVFEKVGEFIAQHGEQTDVIAIPIYFFGAQQGGHPLNRKFSKGSRVVDLDEEWENTQLSLASAFIRSSSAHQYAFKENSKLPASEDARELARILIHNHSIGVVADCGYHYRKWSNSTVATSTLKKSWYLEYFDDYSLSLFRYCMQELAYIPRFLAYSMMYDLQWRFLMTDVPDNVLTDDEKQRYFEQLHAVLQYIHDDVIFAMNHLAIENKIFILVIKYSSKAVLALTRRNFEVWVGENRCFNLQNGACLLEFIELKRGICRLEGTFSLIGGLEERPELLLQCGGTQYLCALTEDVGKLSIGHEILKKIHFCAEFPIDPTTENSLVRFSLRLNGHEADMNNLESGPFFPLSSSLRRSYFMADGFCVRWADLEMTGLLFERQRFGQKLYQEARLDHQLWKENKEGYRKAILARVIVSLGKRLHSKPLWLISDRAAKADDNGEAFFRYMQTHPEIDTRFVINEGCEDYERMKCIGKVLKRNSFKHKIMSLMSDYIVSSQGEVEVTNPFKGHSEPYRDMFYHNRFVFLQHGVIKDDLSNWLKRRNKNITGFITSAKREYDSIVQGNYDYPEENIWLTGLPRFDYLNDAQEKNIVIMPTWRKYLMNHFDPAKGEWLLAPDFKNSRYVSFYSQLLSDPRLVYAAKNLGYCLTFFPHPNIQPFLDNFAHAGYVQIAPKYASYHDIFQKACLCVTDYSSAVFDFLYMRKPVIYTQFDKGEFFAGEHVYSEGYFDYERDGFGEVEYDLDSTVNRIIEYMENGCRMKETYRERVEGFFAYHDQCNCERVYRKILGHSRSE